MRTATTLGTFALGLTLVLAASVGAGRAVGPIGGPSAAVSSAHGAQPHDAQPNDVEPHDAEPHDAHSGAEVTTDEQPQGLSSSTDGYTLRLHTPSLPRGVPAQLALTLLGPDGDPVTEFTRTHDKDLHLVVVRRDGTGFQHVHPVRDTAGRWTVGLTLPAAGSYKVFADTAPAALNEALVLAADLQVAGDYEPVPLPAPARTATVDGYTVRLTGDLVAGRSSPLTLTVSRQGQPVTDLQPYLAAYGHLVSLRDGDLAYLHTHPEGTPDDGRTPAGPDVSFGVDVPTEGTYLLYLDFKHDGVVRTAAFVATARSAP